MLSIIGIMFFGIAIGLIYRNRNLRRLPMLINVIIYLLLFFLGITVGINDLLINNLYTLGFKALIITTGGTFGSIVFSWIVYHYFFRSSPPDSTHST